MRFLFVVLGVVATVAAAAAGGVASLIRPASASVTLSSSGAGARPIALTLRMRYDMQCARPGPGPLVITFPAAERLPAHIATRDVSVDGERATQVERSGQTVTVALPIQHGPLCDVIAPAVLTIVFDRGALLGNPAQAGRYTIAARTPRVTGRASITIR